MATQGLTEFIYGRRTVDEALRTPAPIERILIADGSHGPAVEAIRARADELGIEVEILARAQLDRLVGPINHQGVAARVASYAYAELDDLLDAATVRLILLDGVTDPANLGSILRSAEAFGWTGVLIPKDRAVSVTPVVRKVSSGAAERVPVARVGSAADMVARLRRKDVWVVGLDPGAAPYWEADLLGRVCLVLGAEGRGLGRLVRERCDILAGVPMVGEQASVNVAVAAALVMAEVTRGGGLATT